VWNFIFFWKLQKRKLEPPEVTRARALLDAIDRGGLPLNPARVNAVGRDLGLEVSVRAPMDQTIERIRAALQRVSRH
jgi:hypothetical protein